MSASPPDFVADFDSASAMVTATSSFLRGEDFPALGNPKALKPLAARANLLPERARERLFILGGATETVPPRKLKRLDLDGSLSGWLDAAYPARRYQAVALGSSSGAGVNLHAALGIPWLPQTTLIPVDQEVHPDDPTSAMEMGREPGRWLVEANPGFGLHHMHDANQDRLMVRALTYFRVKKRELGGYERVIIDRLPPGGTILLMECASTWNTTRIGERHVFQHGALGGATEEEFHSGSERVAEYLERYDSPVRRWDGPRPDTKSPEAEWGFEESLREDVLRLARERRYRVLRVVFDEPDALSPLVADLYRWWYRRRRIPANRLLISSFIINDPYWTLRTGSVPYWMKFNMQPSLEAAHRYLDRSHPYDDIRLMLFQHGVRAVGLPTADDWRGLLARARRGGATVGADLSEFPYDFAHFARYHTHVQKIPARYPMPGPLSLQELDAFLAQAGDYEGVEVIDEGD